MRKLESKRRHFFSLKKPVRLWPYRPYLCRRPWQSICNRYDEFIAICIVMSDTATQAATMPMATNEWSFTFRYCFSNWSIMIFTIWTLNFMACSGRGYTWFAVLDKDHLTCSTWYGILTRLVVQFSLQCHACQGMKVNGWYVCLYVCWYVCMYVGMFVCMLVCLFVCMLVCLYVLKCIPLCKQSSRDSSSVAMIWVVIANHCMLVMDMLHWQLLWFSQACMRWSIPSTDLQLQYWFSEGI